ncbi:hypothetical protein [Chryseobacterium wanjuense]
MSGTLILKLDNHKQEVIKISGTVFYAKESVDNLTLPFHAING